MKYFLRYLQIFVLYISYICYIFVRMKKKKLIDIAPDTFKKLTKEAQNQGRSLKNYIERLLDAKAEKL